MSTTLPSRWVRGELVEFVQSVSGYKSGDGWSLIYQFVGKGDGMRFTIEATAYDDLAAYDVIILGSDTQELPVGRYDWQSYVVKDGTKHYIGSGVIDLLQDLATAPTGFDGRDSAEVALANIKAVLANKATKDQLSYTIKNRQLQHYSWKELQEAHDWFAMQVNQAKKKKAKKPSITNSVIRFRRPR